MGGLVMRFIVDVEELTTGWRISIDHSDPPEPTVIETPDLRQGCVLAGEVVFIAADPLQQMFRLPPAQGGLADGLAGPDA